MNFTISFAFLIRGSSFLSSLLCRLEISQKTRANLPAMEELAIAKLPSPVSWSRSMQMWCHLLELNDCTPRIERSIFRDKLLRRCKSSSRLSDGWAAPWLIYRHPKIGKSIGTKSFYKHSFSAKLKFLKLFI